MGTVIAVWVVVWLICMAVGTLLGHRRGNAALGFLCPFVLGPLGLLLSFALLKDPPPVSVER